ncbi:MAG: DUF255 domain-containing protein, partial [Chromatiales bacterium]|nr:DUF255 domain-containing protein [Chromatiales bacterium]
IFAIYANRVYLGAGTQGVEAAARRYFNKSVRNVTLHEAALLAGLLKAPSRYSPLRHPGNAKSRAEQVLKKMVAAGFLSAANAAAAPRRSLTLNRSRATSTQYFADWIMERAAAFVGDGKGDLVITTTLDRRLQKLAAAKLGARLAGEGKRRRANQGALIAMSPDGAVQAMTGQGGWPMSVFITPDLKPFWGGTYFPKESKYGRPGFMTILASIADSWTTKHEDILKSADQLTSRYPYGSDAAIRNS